MKYLPIALIVTSVLTVAGCATHSLTSEIVDPAATSTKGVVYALPKTRLKATVTYTVSTTTSYNNGLKTVALPKAEIRTPLTIEAMLVGDRNYMFVAKGDGLTDAASLDTTFKINLGAEQMLTGLSADTSDRTGDVVKNVVGSVISLAKLAAVAGPATNAAIEKVRRAIESIDSDIAALAVGNDAQKSAKIKALIDQKKQLIEFLNGIQEENKSTIEEKQITYSEILDLKGMTWDDTDKTWSKEFHAPFSLIGVNTDAVVPRVNITIYASELEHAAAEKVYTAADLPAEYKQGILYRVPSYLRIRAEEVGKHTLLDSYVPIMQTGLIAVLEAKSKSFTKRNTSIVFDPQTGSLKEFGVVTESSANAATKSMNESIGSVQSAIAELQKAKKDKEDAEKSDAEQQVAALTEQTSLINAQLALIKAQKELDAAKAPTSSSP